MTEQQFDLLAPMNDGARLRVVIPAHRPSHADLIYGGQRVSALIQMSDVEALKTQGFISARNDESYEIEGTKYEVFGITKAGREAAEQY